jgi:hypothetical protein
VIDVLVRHFSTLATARNTRNCSLARSQDLTNSLHFERLEYGTLIVVSETRLVFAPNVLPYQDQSVGATRAVWWKRAALLFFSITENPSAIPARFF